MVAMTVGDDDSFNVFGIDVVFHKKGHQLPAVHQITRIDKGMPSYTVLFVTEDIDVGPVLKEEIG